ncbi:hypothetical protein V474_07645 [Novosphingobium barchaimii LL02]|uniref:Uncharacterized protein n=1 Tax=Novosphingobium barchaimii LL02 TaxID=1114963 RepID=A0A0J7Y8N1_9SPHN|nr:hypothetical protein [Novosphingobium barchaimii]KMS59967.1 hypothetical protein V474_07645 [Novosphingobium barchaimii LL02]
MTERTISDIDAQIADLKRERDIASLDGSKSVKSVLATGKVATLAADLEALLPSLFTQSVAYQQAMNVISVVTGTRNLVDGEISRIEALVAAQETASS